jgi:hypothetical protein
MRTFTVSIRTDAATRFVILLMLAMCGATPLWAQTEPEAPVPAEKLYNGWQLSFYGGGSMFYTNGEYNGLCDCDFVGDVTSINAIFGSSVNIPVHQDFALYLRAGINNASTTWSSARTDSLLSTGGSGYVLSDMTFDYDLLNLDVLFRLIGSMDGERVYIGPSFGIVGSKHVRITDTELTSGFTRLVEDGPLDVDHSLRVSMIIGAEYAFVPLKNLYVVPAFEVDYAFGKILQDRSARPNFVLRPTYYKLLVTVAYQFL